MIRGFHRRGQPLIALVLLLGSWVSARGMMWDAGQLATIRPAMPVVTAASIAASESPTVPRKAVGGFTPFPDFMEFSANSVGQDSEPAPRTLAVRPPVRQMIRVTFPKSAPAAPAFVSIYPEKYDLAASIPGLHSRSKTAARIASPPPLALAQPTSGVSAPALPASSTSAPTNHRWSVDSWFLWRRGGKTQLTGGILTPSYGASQAGMVLRYRLMRDSGRRLTAYLRTTTALNGSGEREAALGISARPFAGLPLIAAGEARVTGTSDGYILRPAAILITDLPPFALPYGIRGEAYGQAGYVGGRYATPFADGQLRLDHRLWQSGRADLRFGGGIWGGAQRGASRLDAGPSLSLAIPLGRSAGVRATADWRFRVAGNAAPGSGPTLTLSAGF